MKYEKKHFVNSNVVLDGSEFIDCTFNKVSLIYRGGEPPTITGCEFAETQFIFEGCASKTIAFMTALYHGGFQPIIEGTIQNIRKNFNTTRNIPNDFSVIPYINKRSKDAFSFPVK